MRGIPLDVLRHVALDGGDRHGLGRGLRGEHDVPVGHDDRHRPHRDRERPGNRAPAPWAVPERVGQPQIDEHDHEAEAVHPRDGAQLDQQGLPVLRVAEEHPRQAQEAGVRAHVLEADPERRAKEHRRHTAAAVQPPKAECPDAEVLRQIEAERRLVERIVGGDLPDPLEHTDEEHEAGHVREQERAARSAALDGEQQRDERDPGEPMNVERRKARDEEQPAQNCERDIDQQTHVNSTMRAAHPEAGRAAHVSVAALT